LFGLAACLRPLPIGRIFTPLLLLCVACGSGRTSLTDTTVAVSTSDGDDQASWNGGPLAATPGQVRCGSITCGVGDKCCLRQEGRPASNGCALLNDTCHGTQDTRVCDETADCAPGEICCLGVFSDPPPTIGSYCVPSTDGKASCDRNDFVACGSDDDCRAVGAPSCVAQRCRADILQSCGLMPSSYCPP
jgi:hypothetical protein